MQLTPNTELLFNQDLPCCLNFIVVAATVLLLKTIIFTIFKVYAGTIEYFKGFS